MDRADAVAWAEALERRIEVLLVLERSPLPERPDGGRADAWLVAMYREWWDRPRPR